MLARQVRFEQKTFWRNPAAVFFTLGLPILMLNIFATLNAGEARPDGRTFESYFVPGMVVFGLLNATYGYLATKLVARRDSGLLKRARATPLPLAVLLGGMVCSAIAITAMINVLVLLVGRLVYDVALPDRWGILVAVFVVGAASFSALGLALGNVIPNVDASEPIVFGTVLPVLFISGVFDVVQEDSLLDRIAEVLPVSHLLAAALATSGEASLSYVAGHLAVVAVWGVAGVAVATTCFRWRG